MASSFLFGSWYVPARGRSLELACLAVRGRQLITFFFPSQERHPSYRFIFNSVAVCANGEQKSSKDLSIERYLAGEGAGAPGPRRRGHIACAIYVSYLYVTFAARMYIVLYIVLLSTAVLVFFRYSFWTWSSQFFFCFFLLSNFCHDG